MIPECRQKLPAAVVCEAGCLHQSVMVCSCCVPHCTERQTPGTVFSFHEFPYSRPEEVQAWISAIKRKNFVPKKGYRVCSKHFKEDCFEVSPVVSHMKGLNNQVQPRRNRKLKPNVCPTIFPGYPNYLQPACKKKRGSPKFRLRIATPLEHQFPAVEDEAEEERETTMSNAMECDTTQRNGDSLLKKTTSTQTRR